jgi:hypothetical protein
MFFAKKVNMLEKRIVLLYNIIGNHMFIKEKTTRGIESTNTVKIKKPRDGR